MRLIRAFFWGMVGVVVGAFEGGTLAWALDYPLLLIPAALVGGALGLLIGVLYGLFAPRPKPERAASPERARVSFERCARCQGTGWEEPKKQRHCRTCEGKGQVLVPVPPRPCATCKGKGRLFPKRTCKRCDGAGWETYSLLKPAEVPETGPAVPKKRSRFIWR